LAKHRAFAVVGPELWNDLPPAIGYTKTLAEVPFISSRCLKTFVSCGLAVKLSALLII